MSRRLPWQQDNITYIFSVGKPFAIFALLMLDERDEIELYDRVAKYWPEYAHASKETTTVRHIVRCAERARRPAK